MKALNRRLLRMLRPDVLVKGADWAADEIVGRDVVEARGGRVVRPALLWNDTRSAQAAADLDAEFPDLVERTGSRPVASFTSTKLRWLRDAEPVGTASGSQRAMAAMTD